SSTPATAPWSASSAGRRVPTASQPAALSAGSFRSPDIATGSSKRPRSSGRRSSHDPTMIGRAATLACALACSLPAAAMGGGAQPAKDGAGRAVVMLTGSHGTFCSGVALANNLVLTAAHCVLPGADYKLVELDAARLPALKDLATIVRHPEFDVTA